MLSRRRRVGQPYLYSSVTESVLLSLAARMRGGCPNFLIIFCVTQRRLLQVHERVHATARGAASCSLFVLVRVVP